MARLVGADPKKPGKQLMWMGDVVVVNQRKWPGPLIRRGGAHMDYGDVPSHALDLLTSRLIPEWYNKIDWKKFLMDEQDLNESLLGYQSYSERISDILSALLTGNRTTYDCGDFRGLGSVSQVPIGGDSFLMNCNDRILNPEVRFRVQCQMEHDIPLQTGEGSSVSLKEEDSDAGIEASTACDPLAPPKSAVFLPPDILTFIFNLSCIEDEERIVVGPSSIPLVISGVSAQWRSVALSLPDFANGPHASSSFTRSRCTLSSGRTSRFVSRGGSYRMACSSRGRFPRCGNSLSTYPITGMRNARSGTQQDTLADFTDAPLLVEQEAMLADSALVVHSAFKSN
ncbi:hypothetical protein C8R44DRAFT_752801 [Mycena epipterygia]|nr:hypothetical protein C8R44DRAFT_752801 [Mycena epipterygia]